MRALRGGKLTANALLTKARLAGTFTFANPAEVDSTLSVPIVGAVRSALIGRAMSGMNYYYISKGKVLRYRGH